MTTLTMVLLLSIIFVKLFAVYMLLQLRRAGDYFYLVGVFDGKVEHVERLRPSEAIDKIAYHRAKTNPDRYDWVLITYYGQVFRYGQDEEGTRYGKTD